MRRVLVGMGLTLALATTPARAADAPLPDWRGVWSALGGAIFDSPQIRGRAPGGRDHPPYNAEWEKKYQDVIAKAAVGVEVDPVAADCKPHGMPRIMGPMPHTEPNAEPMEFILTPDQVWIAAEWGPQVRRIFMNRPHPPADDLYPTYNGDSIGHWEGDTLVVDTIQILEGTYDHTAAPHSDQLHVVERIRKVDADTLEDRMVIEDPAAFTAPWSVTRQWRRRTGVGARLYDFSCAENPGKF